MIGARAWLCLCALSASCATPPFGELLLVLDTNVAVPEHSTHVRVDLYDPDDGDRWYASRTFTTLSADEWPLSFSLATEDATTRALVRIRAYPDRAERPYRGEIPDEIVPVVEPSIATSAPELCETALPLTANTNRTLRLGGEQIIGFQTAPDCPLAARGGASAVTVQILQANNYRFEVIRTVPDANTDTNTADTIMALRAACDNFATEVACGDEQAESHHPIVVTHLEPGTYTWIVAAKFARSPIDVTLRWSVQSEWSLPFDNPAPSASTPTSAPRLITSAGDQTPALEPTPRLTIDRLVEATLTRGLRQTGHLLLHGECLGTQASMANRESCIATAGKRESVATPALSDRVERTGRVAPGSWDALVPRTCESAAPAAMICVPAGVVRVGSNVIPQVDRNSASPEFFAIVEPFFIDAEEVSVAAVRRALASGFRSSDLTVNNRPISVTAGADRACTFNGDDNGPAPDIDRERFPINCVDWNFAHDYCAFVGARLPTNAEWEFAALVAGREQKSLYPWGESRGTCAVAVIGRLPGNECVNEGVGPASLDSASAQADKTPLGILGFGGNLSEYVGDGGYPYTSDCWRQRILHGVECRDSTAPLRVVRGADFTVLDAPPSVLKLAGSSEPSVNNGFRCARSVMMSSGGLP